MGGGDLGSVAASVTGGYDADDRRGGYGGGEAVATPSTGQSVVVVGAETDSGAGFGGGSWVNAPTDAGGFGGVRLG